MDKAALIAALVGRLTEDLALYHKAATTARAEATHEQSKAEHKYDTRGLEASYLARGQSRQAAEIEASIRQIGALAPRAFGADDAVDVGAYVEVRDGRGIDRYFVAPRAGGTEVLFEGLELTVITPQSPLGTLLMGRRRGETLGPASGAKGTARKIAAVA
jgi:transcription elongation GreA/GreB family factor